MTTPSQKRGRPAKSAAETPTEPLFSGVESVVAHRPLSLLEVQDSADLDAILLDARVKMHVISRLAPNFALINPGSEKAVLDALKKAGHTPKVVGRNA